MSYSCDYSAGGGNNPRWIPDAAWVTGQTGGGGSGFTISANGLSDNGSTTVCLGGTLDQNTGIDGDSYTYAFSATSMSAICLGGADVYIGDQLGNTSGTFLFGCGVSCVQVGALDICLRANNDGDIKHCVNSTSCHIFCGGDIYMPDVATCTSETNVLYINAAGKISSGATSGGGSSAGASGDTQLSNGSGGFICSIAGDLKQISGGSWVQGLSSCVVGSNSCVSEVHGWLNTIENSQYSYAFGYGNCICATPTFPGGNYGTFIAGTTNYDQSDEGSNVLIGYSNSVFCDGYISVLLGNNNRACCTNGVGGATYAMLMGDTNCGEGVGPVAIGYGNFACDYGYAIGYNNFAEGQLSAAIGYGNSTCPGAIAAVAIGDGGIIYSGACSAMVHGYGAIGEVASERASSAGGVTNSDFGTCHTFSRGYTREINFFGYTSGTTGGCNLAQLMTKYCPAGGGAHCCCFFNLTPRRHAMGFHINVTGTDLTNNDSASFFFEGAIKMNDSGGTVSWVGTPSCTAYCDSGFNVNAQIYANNTDKRLDICVTGETATCIGWAATLWGTQIRKVNVDG